MSFSLEKKSGNKCYMLAARSLKISWGEDDTYWKWISLPHSRFSEVAVLGHVWWLEIRGEISPKMLSPGTNYGAYLVFSLKSNAYGFDNLPIDASVGISRQEAKTRTVYLGFERSRVGPSAGVGRIPGMLRHNRSPPSEEENANTGHVRQRSDHWMEVELGDILVTGEEEEEEEECIIEMSFMEVRGGNQKSGLVVQGIEIRPKEAMP
ncbi:unnamed protein product [Cuscuta campestris]|uniref:F-box domain-containing protein n=1 Tax=Cuscuta campestris TaxID=132261 RepID=A0A484NI33_9ASTE|nr:unnamed protein product [Cuscuta campestris]